VIDPTVMGPGATDPDEGHTDCAVVIREVWAMLDGEVTNDERELLRHHLDHCPECLRHYGVEERIKKLIATRCSGEKAPSYLVERVRVQISRTTIIRRQI
jgi:anti-sigma factor (TIGR02949 family)